MTRPFMALGIVVLCGPALAQAQSVPLARLLSNSLATAAKIERPLTGSDATSQGDNGGHFYNTALQQKAPAELDASLSTQLTAFPTAFAWGSSAPNPGVSTEFRMRGTGSSFVESPATLGRKRVTFSFGHETTEFGGIDSASLRDGTTALWTAHDDCCSPAGSAPNPEFERDLLEQRVAVDIDRHMYSMTAAFGITDRLDLGVMVPIGHTRMNARIASRIVRVATTDTFIYGFNSSTGTPQPVPHAYDAVEIANRTTYYSGDSQGIGDVVVKAKYRIAGKADGVALSLGAFLPTGDPDKLLGTGTFRADASLLLSRNLRRFSPHVNVGYTYAAGQGSDSLTTGITSTAAVPSTADVPDVLHGVVGVDWAPHRRVQLSVDAMGRRLSGVTRFSTQTATFPVGGALAASKPTYVAADNLTANTSGSAFVQLLGVGSVRVFAAGHSLCTLELLFPLNDQGLQSRVTAVAGLSWGF
jgi:hypothetical protein